MNTTNQSSSKHAVQFRMLPQAIRDLSRAIRDLSRVIRENRYLILRVLIFALIWRKESAFYPYRDIA